MLYYITHTTKYISYHTPPLAMNFITNTSIHPLLNTYYFPWEKTWNCYSAEYACYVTSFGWRSRLQYRHHMSYCLLLLALFSTSTTDEYSSTKHTHTEWIMNWLQLHTQAHTVVQRTAYSVQRKANKRRANYKFQVSAVLCKIRFG